MRMITAILLLGLSATLARPAAAVQVETIGAAATGPRLVPLLQSQTLLRQDLTDRAGRLDAAAIQRLLNAPAPTFDRSRPMSIEESRAQRADEALRLLLVHPELLDEDSKTLNALIDFKNVKAIRTAAAELRQRVDAEPGSALGKRYKDLQARFDLAGARSVDELRERLDRAMDNARAAGRATGSTVLGKEGAGTPVLAKAEPVGKPRASVIPAPAMDEAALQAYLTDKINVSNVGLKTARFPAGDYRDEYEPLLKRMGVDVLMIMEPTEAELDARGEDKGFFLRPESYRWVSPAMAPEDFLSTVARDTRNKMARELNSSRALKIVLSKLTLGLFDEWYPIYKDEIGGRPGGQLYVKPDHMLRQIEQDGNLDRWWTIFYRDQKDGRLIGGVNVKEWPDRKMVWGHYAAYREETKPYNVSVRSFLEVLNLTRQLGYPVMSLGLDFNLRGFYRSIGLLLNKTRLRAMPYPEEEITLTKILDTSKFKEEKNGRGENEGLVFFSLPRGGVIEQRYREALREGRVAQAHELLGGDYFSKEIVPAGISMVMRHFFTDPVVLAPPTGFSDSVIRQPLDTLNGK